MLTLRDAPQHASGAGLAGPIQMLSRNGMQNPLQIQPVQAWLRRTAGRHCADRGHDGV